MYPISCIANRENGKSWTTDVQWRERGVTLFPTANSPFTPSKKDHDVWQSRRVTRRSLGRFAFPDPNRKQSNGNYGHYTRVLGTDNTEQQYTRAKITMRSGFRTPDVRRSFSKMDPVQAVQNFRSGRDGQRADARVRLVRALQTVRSGWTFRSMEASETIRLAR